MTQTALPSLMVIQSGWSLAQPKEDGPWPTSAEGGK